MNHFEWTWDSKGRKVYAQGWTPANVKAVVCLVHGFAEFSDRYEHVAKFLCDAGFAVLAYDQLGHGKTEGKRGHADYEDMLDNVKTILQEADTPSVANCLQSTLTYRDLLLMNVDGKRECASTLGILV